MRQQLRQRGARLASLASPKVQIPLLLFLLSIPLGSAEAKPPAPPPPPSPPAAQPAAPKPAQIDRNGVLILIRSTLLALHQGNETGNYTVLRDLSAPGFRDANTAARLSEIFASQRAQRLDLSGVAVLEPQLTVLPQIEGNGLLRMAGFFPSVPMQINFELLYAPVEGRWRIFGIAVTVASSTPQAPSAPAPAQTASPAPSGPASQPNPANRGDPTRLPSPAVE